MEYPTIVGAFLNERAVATGQIPIMVKDDVTGETRLCDLHSELGREATASRPQHWIYGFHARLAGVLEANRDYLLGEDAAELAGDRVEAEAARRHGTGD